MNGRGKLSAVILAVIAAAVLGFFLADRLLPHGAPGMQGQSETFLVIKSIITTINMALCLVLIGSYLSLYSQVRSKFTLGLVFTMFSLLVYAASSNPVIHALSGYCLAGLGPFTILPDIFAAAALGILLYLSET